MKEISLDNKENFPDLKVYIMKFLLIKDPDLYMEIINMKM